MVFGGKFRIRRSNSKASYLPRQSHEKLTSDPDYGSYKLTLTSNEDCIHLPNNVFHEQIHSTKMNNLPDVLPMGVKMKSVAPRYGSNTNLNMKSMSIASSTSKAVTSTSSVNTVTKATTATTISTQQIIKSNGLVGETIKELSDQLPTSPRATTNNNPLSHIALKSMFNIHNRNNKNSIEHNNMINSNHMNDPISPTKYMSQSTIDLKKAQHLYGNEIIFNHHSSQSNGHVHQRIMSTESVNSLADNTNRQSAPAYFFQQQLQQQNGLLRKSYDGSHHLSTLSSNTKLTNGNNGSINTNGLPSLNGRKDDKIIRNDSLKENIDKITQLQSKLMSSHFNDHSKDLSQSSSELSMQNNNNMNNSMIIEDDTTFNDSFKTDLSNVSSDSMAFIDINNINVMNQTNVAINSCSPPSSSSSTLSSLSSSTPSSIDSNLIAKDNLSDVNEPIVKLNETFTSEVGSQTDEIILDSLSSSLSLNDLPGSIALSARAKCVEEIDCEKLADLLIQKLAPTDRLRNILAPKVYKSTTDYITGLYNPFISSRSIKKDAGTSMHREQQRLDLTGNTPMTNGNYYSIVETTQPTIKQINTSSRFNREMTLINGDVCDLTKQKEELVVQLTKQLVALTNDRMSITDQNTTNDLLGTDISSVVSNKARPSEATKFRSYVDDVGHITMLLLSLSGRLARTENSLFSISDATEKKLLDSKRVRLLEQLDEAKRLKIDIDRRGKVIGNILQKHLTNEEYADYEYFINTKAKLIVELREISDKIRLSEEQLNALKDTLVHSEC